MNKKIVFMVVGLAMIGCTREVTVTPCQIPVSSVTHGEVIATTQGDDFDEAGRAAAMGARWTFNKVKNTYEWVMSPEMQDRASRAWQTTKQVTVKAADVVTDTAHKLVDEKK